MAYNIVTKQTTLTVISRQVVFMFLIEATLGGYKFKDDCEVETAETQQLMKQGTDLYWQGTEKLVPWYDIYLNCGAGLCVKSSMCVVQFNINRYLTFFWPCIIV